jgi:hypothetical protein
LQAAELAQASSNLFAFRISAYIATNSWQAVEPSREKNAFMNWCSGGIFFANAVVGARVSCHARRKYRAFPTASWVPMIKIRYRLKASGQFTGMSAASASTRARSPPVRSAMAW